MAFRVHAFQAEVRRPLTVQRSARLDRKANYAATSQDLALIDEITAWATGPMDEAEVGASWANALGIEPGVYDLYQVTRYASRAEFLALAGLVPSWGPDSEIGNRMINARAETLTEKPSFGRLVPQRRCLSRLMDFMSGAEKQSQGSSVDSPKG